MIKIFQKLKYTWKCKGCGIAKTIFKKQNKGEELIHPDFKTYYQAAIIKTV